MAKKIFYQQLSIRINELENKKQFKCIWLGLKMKEEKELILYPNKNGTVADLLEEAKKQVELSEDGSGKLRIVEVNCNKLVPGPKEDVLLDTLNLTSTKTYRIEEIPKEEACLQDDEMLVPCAHYHKEVFSTFGTPFYVKIKHGEPFNRVKERIQKKISVPEKEWEKYKFAIVSIGRPQYVTDEEYNINLQDFKLHPTQSKFFLFLFFLFFDSV